MKPPASFGETSLCVVGNINRDLRTAPFAAGPQLLQDGETSVAAVVETVGGGGANSALAAAALGARVAFLGKVGADALGAKLEEAMRARGVATYLTRDDRSVTGTSMALTYDNGQRHFVSCLPNNAALRMEDLDLTILSSYRHLLRADVWFSEEMLYGGNEQLFRAARAAGLAISLDLNWDPCWGRAAPAEIRRRKEAVRALLPHVAIAHGNVQELIEFAEATDLDGALQSLENWGTQSVVVHRGDQGAGWHRDGTMITAPAVAAKCRVNTTGTGDLLSVCMILWQQLEPAAVREQLEWSNQLVSEFIEGKHEWLPPL